MAQEAIRVTERPAEVFVVSMNGTVLLLVDGAATPDNQALIDEMRDSFVATGTPADDVQVIWQSRRRSGTAG